MPLRADLRNKSQCAVLQVEMMNVWRDPWIAESPEADAWWDEARSAANMKGCASE